MVSTHWIEMTASAAIVSACLTLQQSLPCRKREQEPMQQRRQCQADKEQGHVGLGLLTVDRPDRPPPLRRHQLRRCTQETASGQVRDRTCACAVGWLLLIVQADWSVCGVRNY